MLCVTVVTGQWGVGYCIEPVCTRSGKYWFFPIWLNFEKPFFKNNHQCFIPFWGIKTTSFFSNQQNRAIKWKSSSYLTPLGWLHAPVGLCGGQASRVDSTGLSLWAGASNPGLLGDLKWKKRVGPKISTKLTASAIAVYDMSLQLTPNSECCQLYMVGIRGNFEVASERYQNYDSTLLCVLLYLGV